MVKVRTMCLSDDGEDVVRDTWWSRKDVVRDTFPCGDGEDVVGDTWSREDVMRAPCDDDDNDDDVLSLVMVALLHRKFYIHNLMTN